MVRTIGTHGERWPAAPWLWRRSWRPRASGSARRRCSRAALEGCKDSFRFLQVELLTFGETARHVPVYVVELGFRFLQVELLTFGETARHVPVYAVEPGCGLDDGLAMGWAHVAEGNLLKGKALSGARLQSTIGTHGERWPCFTGGPVAVAAQLAAACERFCAKTLFAGPLEGCKDSFRFLQVELLTFGETARHVPVYAVEPGCGLDDGLAMGWAHVAEGNLLKGTALLEDKMSRSLAVAAMKNRVAQSTASLSEGGGTYAMRLATIAVCEHSSQHAADRRTKDVAQHHDRIQKNLDMVFVCVKLQSGKLTQDRIREAAMCFALNVEQCGGRIEALLEDRYVARWDGRHFLTDSIRFARHFEKVLVGLRVGIAITVGTGDLITLDRIDFVYSLARLRAEWLAAMSLTHGMYIVADACVAESHELAARGRKRGSEVAMLLSDAVKIRKNWRSVSFSSVFAFDEPLACEEVVEMLRSDVHPLYTDAMQKVKDRLWGEARELLQQYNEVVDADEWAAKLQRAVTKALHEEAAGLRSPDMPLTLYMNAATAYFDNEHDEPGQAGPRAVVPAAPHGQRASTTVFANIPTLAALRDRSKVRQLLGLHGGDNQSSVQERTYRFAEMWNVLRLVSLMVDLFLIPTRATRRYSEWTASFVAVMTCQYLFDVVAVVDIVCNFNEPVTNDRGIRITSKTAIACIYLRTWFSIDLLSCLPWELFVLPFNPNFILNYPECRANRFLNVLRFSSQTHSVAESYMSEAHPIVVRLFVHLVILIYALYWLGCAWQYYADPVDEQYYKIPNFNDLSENMRNLHGFHWALRGFAGYGQPWPATDLQHAMCIVNVVVGIAVFATVIASMQNSMKMTHNEVFLSRLDSVVAVADHRCLDHETTSAILKYHRMLWAKTKQVYEGQFDDLKEELPTELVSELSYFANVRAVEKIKVLQNFQDPRVFAEIVSKLQMQFGTPGEKLVMRGDEYSAEQAGLYFIFSGEAVAMLDDKVFEEVEEGGFWGEVTCLYHVPQPADLCLKTYCELYFLPVRAFHEMLDEFPSSAAPFIESSAVRREKIRSVMMEEVREARRHTRFMIRNSVVSRRSSNDEEFPEQPGASADPGPRLEIGPPPIPVEPSFRHAASENRSPTGWSTLSSWRQHASFQKQASSWKQQQPPLAARRHTRFMIRNSVVSRRSSNDEEFPEQPGAPADPGPRLEIGPPPISVEPSFRHAASENRSPTGWSTLSLWRQHASFQKQASSWKQQQPPLAARRHTRFMIRNSVVSRRSSNDEEFPEQPVASADPGPRLEIGPPPITVEPSFRHAASENQSPTGWSTLSSWRQHASFQKQASSWKQQSPLTPLRSTISAEITRAKSNSHEGGALPLSLPSPKADSNFLGLAAPPAGRNPLSLPSEKKKANSACFFPQK
ncbi:Cyclic nucleotide-gated cation channel subunit A [Diplonema papillatum]|nr:Cyclic nucleotide-gated cation channel subunit A [Diplonema papillatum]